jgi:hypothetical protein
MNRTVLRTTVGAMLAATVAAGLLANCGAPTSQAPTLPAPTLWLTETPTATPPLQATVTPLPGPTATDLVTPTPVAEAVGGQEPATPTPPPPPVENRNR